MDFIFMLTRDDQTVEDCLELVDEIAPLGLSTSASRTWASTSTGCARSTPRSRRPERVSYMEVVSTSREAELRSIAVAREIGVDRLLGGTAVGETLAMLGGSTAYYPVPGPSGRPSDQARRLPVRGRGADRRASWRWAAPGATSSPTAPRRPIRSSWSGPRAGASATAC